MASGSPAAAATDAVTPKSRLGNLYLGPFHKNVQGDIEVNGPGPTLQHAGERLTDHQGKLFRPGCLKATLNMVADDAGEIGLKMPPGLLEGPSVELAGGHIARDG